MSRGVARLVTAVALLLALAVGWSLRVSAAHANPAWDETAQRTQAGLLKSDPALLYWFTDRIAKNGGSIPDDFAKCTAVQWPDEVDARVEFPMLQPWLAANLWRWFGGSDGGAAVPLHEFCLSLFAFTAALTALAAWGLAFELTRRHGPALVALALFFLLPANWRTASFVLVGEDVAFPCFALHLWLLARAARVKSAASFLLAGLFLALAMAAWHATGFFVAIEAGAFFLWYLRTGQNPFDTQAARGGLSNAWLVLVPFALACTVEPMLRGKLQILSLPMQLAFALLGLALVERKRRLAPLARVGVAVGLVGLFLGAGLVASRALGRGLGDYSHVFRLVAAKLATFGSKPRDPDELPFEVRILWQGPFDTLQWFPLWLHLSGGLLGTLVVVLAAGKTWASGRGDARAALVALVALASLAALIATRLILRTEILAGLLLAVVPALLLARIESAWPRRALAAALLAAPAFLFPQFLTFLDHTNAWYEPSIVADYRGAIAAVDRLVPRGEAVASDEILSTALLASCDRPILVQPKYEWTAARDRLREYRMAATRGSPKELADFLRAHRCRFLAYDWSTLLATRYQAGLHDDVRDPARALAELDANSALVIAATRPTQLPGFELLWKSDPRETPRGGIRLYRLGELSEERASGATPGPGDRR